MTPSHCRTFQLDCVDERSVRGMTLEVLPTAMARCLQFVLVADHIVMPAVFAYPDRQRQSPIALLADHPVVHIAQPVHLA